jgi:hypothetical protein
VLLPLAGSLKWVDSAPIGRLVRRCVFQLGMAEQVAVTGLVHRAEGDSGAVVAAGSRAAADGWTVRYEFVVVDGDAAEQLMSRQAAAVRAALEYFAQYPTSRPAQAGHGGHGVSGNAAG